ncbi:unnamed protein product [Amoebophrya sp. A25]|nr:unnamed protein product [Amoebophrya sp. A25]|eukprot:GSA25T00014633001.1
MLQKARTALASECGRLRAAGEVQFDWAPNAMEALGMNALSDLQSVQSVVDRVHAVARDCGLPSCKSVVLEEVRTSSSKKGGQDTSTRGDAKKEDDSASASSAPSSRQGRTKENEADTSRQGGAAVSLPPSPVLRKLGIPECTSVTPGTAAQTACYTRRTDLLQGIDRAPQCLGQVLEVERTADRGTLLTVLVKYGVFQKGAYFACGSAFGRVHTLYEGDDVLRFRRETARSAKLMRCATVNVAKPGMAVRVMGLRNGPFHGGDVSNGDIFMVFERERAFRLHLHRFRIEELTKSQRSGPPLQVPWEFDPVNLGNRVEADLSRGLSRLARAASGAENRDRKDVRPNGDEDDTTENYSDDEDALEGEDGLESTSFDSSVEEFGGNSHKRPIFKKGKSRMMCQDDDSDSDSGLSRSEARSILVEPTTGTTDTERGSLGFDESHSLPRGRKSARRRKHACGSREGGQELGEDNRASSKSNALRDHVYYADKMKNAGRDHQEAASSSTAVGGDDSVDFTSEAGIDTQLTLSRWQKRNAARWKQQERDELQLQSEQLASRAISRRVLNLPPDTDPDFFRKKQAEKDKRAQAFAKEKYYDPETYNADAKREGQECQEAQGQGAIVLESDEHDDVSSNRHNSSSQSPSFAATMSGASTRSTTPGSRTVREEDGGHEDTLDHEAHEPGDDMQDVAEAVEAGEGRLLVQAQELATNALPSASRRPVISVMLRCKNVGLFDAVQSELTRLETELQVRLPIVHGGIGPVVPKDIIHAEIERKYGYSPVYALLTGVHSQAIQHATLKRIEVRKHRVLQTLIQDIRDRCVKVQWKVTKAKTNDEVRC